MKKQLVIVIIIISLISNVTIGQNLLLHYTFDNDVKDQSGNNNDGVINGSIHSTIDRFGNPCSVQIVF